MVIGSSTGGPKALTEFFKGLDPALKIPIFIVQHLHIQFTESLCQHLAEVSGRTFVVAKDQMLVASGNVYVSPGDFHMVLKESPKGPMICLNQEPPENFCRPAVDQLFRTAAEIYKTHLLAVVFTGMGEDGKRGCEVVERMGGYIIAQDEASSVVWGMPGAVARAGLANEVLPLLQIAGRIKIITDKKRVA